MVFSKIILIIFFSRNNNLTLEPDPNWANILDPDTNSMYLVTELPEPEPPFLARAGAVFLVRLLLYSTVNILFLRDPNYEYTASMNMTMTMTMNKG